MDESPLITAFLSYSHDSNEHQQRVISLADRLCGDGVYANIDAYEPAPEEGWPHWMRRQIEENKFVLVVCTETYRRRAEGIEDQGIGLGVTWEAGVITQHLYESQGRNRKFLPVIFSSGDVQSVPTFLRPYTFYDLSTPDGYTRLLRQLTSQPEHIRPVIGQIPTLPPAVRPESPLNAAAYYSTESGDDYAHMHQGYFYPWVQQTGHYELAVYPDRYNVNRIDRSQLHHILESILNNAPRPARRSIEYPFREPAEIKNFLANGHSGIERMVRDVQNSKYEMVRLHQSGEFRLIRIMPDDYKDGTLVQDQRTIRFRSLVEHVSSLWLHARRMLGILLEADEGAEVAVRVDGLLDRKLIMPNAVPNDIGLALMATESHSGTQNLFRFTGSLTHNSEDRALTIALEQLGEICWTFGIVDGAELAAQLQRDLYVL